MIISIDTEKLQSYGISPDDYVYLHGLVHKQKHKTLLRPDKRMIQLSGLIKINDGKLILRPKLRELFPDESFDEWIKSYRLIFKGTRNHKSLGDKQVVTHKMRVFMKAHPEYTQENITNAAERYVNRCRSEGVPNRQADFFIYKQELVEGVMVKKSDLLSTLEDLENAVKVHDKIQSIKSNTEW